VRDILRELSQGKNQEHEGETAKNDQKIAFGKGNRRNCAAVNKERNCDAECGCNKKNIPWNLK
jgi:membrane protein involved in colicin uptake